MGKTLGKFPLGEKPLGKYLIHLSDNIFLSWLCPGIDDNMILSFLCPGINDNMILSYLCQNINDNMILSCLCPGIDDNMILSCLCPGIDDNMVLSYTCTPSTKLSVHSAVNCSTITEDIVAFSGQCARYLILVRCA